jgi:hypothetical protein
VLLGSLAPVSPASNSVTLVMGHWGGTSKHTGDSVNRGVFPSSGPGYSLCTKSAIILTGMRFSRGICQTPG